MPVTSYPNAIERPTSEALRLLLGEHRSVKSLFGLACDGRTRGDVTATASSDLLTVPSSWLGIAVGQKIYVRGAGPGGVGKKATVTQLVNSTTIRMDSAAATTVAPTWVRYGTDDTVKLRAAIADLVAQPPNAAGVLRIPKGLVIVSQQPDGKVIDLPPGRYGLIFEGEGFCSLADPSAFQMPSSSIACLDPVPIFSGGSTYPDRIFGIGFCGLGIHGVPDAGSIGIRFQEGYSTRIEGCMFDMFGHNAAKLIGGVDAVIESNWVQNTMMVHTGWADFEGGFDIANTDAFIQHNNFNTSFPEAYSGPATGFICAMVYRQGNGFIGPNMFAQSEIGLFMEASWNRVIGARADLNQRHGFYCYGTDNDWSVCTAHRNSRAGDELWDGFYIPGGNNTFTGCRVTGIDGVDTTAPGHKRHRYGFNDVANFGDPYVFRNTYVNCRVTPYGAAQEFHLQGTNLKSFAAMVKAYGDSFTDLSDTLAVIKADSPASGKLLAVGGSTRPYARLHISDEDNPVAFPLLRLEARNPNIFIRNILGSTDEHVWMLRGNGGTQLFLVAAKDDLSAESVGISFVRVGHAIEAVSFPSGTFTVEGATTINDTLVVNGNAAFTAGLQCAHDLLVNGGLVLDADADAVKVFTGSGSPEGVVTAPGGSLYLRTSGGRAISLYVKISGTGNTGWAAAFVVPTPGASGTVLTSVGGDDATWQTPAGGGLPPQGGNAGKFLETNGSSASWDFIQVGDVRATGSGANLVPLTNGSQQLQLFTMADLANLLKPFLKSHTHTESGTNTGQANEW